MSSIIEWYKKVKTLKPVCTYFYNSNYCYKRDDIPLCICDTYTPKDDATPIITKMFIEELKNKIIRELQDIAGDVATGICLENNDWDNLNNYTQIIYKRLKQSIENIFAQFLKGETLPKKIK